MLTALCGAAPAQAEPDRGINVETAGLMRYRNNQWGLVSAELANESFESVELIVKTQFRTAPRVQFARRLWLPARSRRRFALPVMPTQLVPDEQSVTIDSVLLEPEEQQDRPLAVSSERSLIIADAKVQTAIMRDIGVDMVGSTVVAMRAASGLKARLSYMRNDQLPHVAAGWDMADGLVLAQRNPQFGTTQLEAFRQWLIGGGRLWVMLDQVDPAFMAQLLGGDWTVQIVDEVALPELVIQGSRYSERREFEDPVRMLRVLAPGYKVIHQIRGWPASLRQHIGMGQVLITTVGARAWIADPTAKELARTDLVARRPTASLRELANWFNQRRIRPGQRAAELDAYVSGRIGRRVLDRSVILGMLGGFSLAILACGMGLMKTGRLAHLGWIGPSLAVAVGVALIGVGASIQQKIPTTVAQTALVQVLPQQSRALINASTATYSPGLIKELPLRGPASTNLWPDLIGRTGKPVRLIFADDGSWRWRHLKLEPNASIRDHQVRLTRLDGSLAAALRFGIDRVHVQIQGEFVGDRADPVIATSSGALAARFSDSQGGADQLTANFTNAHHSGQFIAGTTLDDLQRARQDVYRRLLGPEPEKALPTATLLVWSSPPASPVQRPSGAERRADSLMMIPLRIERPPSGTWLTIPSTFLSYEGVNRGNGFIRPLAFDQSRRWIADFPHSARFGLRFDLPKQLLPFQIESLKLTLDIDASGRKVELFDLGSGVPQRLKSFQGPQEPLEINLTAGSGLQPDLSGAVHFGLDVGKLPDPKDRRSWSIRRLEFQVRGTVR